MGFAARNSASSGSMAGILDKGEGGKRKEGVGSLAAAVNSPR